MEIVSLSDLCEIISPANSDITAIDPLTALDSVPDSEKINYMQCKLAYSSFYKDMRLSNEIPAVFLKKNRFNRKQQIQLNDILLSTNMSEAQLVGVVDNLGDLPVYPANDTFIIRPKTPSVIEPLLMYFKSESYKKHFSNTRSEGEHHSMTLANLRKALIPAVTSEMSGSFKKERLKFSKNPCGKNYCDMMSVVSLAVDGKGKAPLNRRQYLLIKYELEGLVPSEEAELLQLQKRHEKFLAKRGNSRQERILKMSEDIFNDLRYRHSAEYIRKEAQENAAYGTAYVNDTAIKVLR